MIPKVPFYFIRHGRSVANTLGVMAGSAHDCDLCPSGIEQIHEAGKILKAENISVIISSPMIRARKTAEIIADYLKLPIDYHHDLREQGMGQWEKVPFESVKHLWPHTDPPGGETEAELKLRVRSVFNELLVRHERPLIVSHGGFWYRLTLLLGFKDEYLHNATPMFLQHSGNWSAKKLGARE